MPNQYVGISGGPNDSKVVVSDDGALTVTGTITTDPGGATTANQGTAAAVGDAWPIKVTNGTNTASVDATLGLAVNVSNTANIPVAVNGIAQVNGTVQLKDSGGTNIANVFPSGAVKIQDDLVQLTAVTTVNAQTGAITGTTVDFGSVKENISLAIIVGAGVSGGVIDLQVSHNGNDWIKHSSSAVLAAATNQILTGSSLAFRYARAVSSTNVAGGNVTVTVMGS